MWPNEKYLLAVCRYVAYSSASDTLRVDVDLRVCKNLPMAVILRLKNKKCITQLLRAFADKKQITVDITSSTLRVSSLSPPFIYLSIPSTLYQADQCITFTISAASLLSNMDLLDAHIAILDKSVKLVTTLDSQKDDHIHRLLTAGGAVDVDAIIADCSFIDIPFIGPIRDSYTRITNFSTKLLIGRNALKSLLPGIVTYSNEDGLVLRKFDGASEDVMRIDVEYLERGYLDFCCSNAWVGSIGAYLDDITTALLGFTDGLLCVRLRFRGQSDVHMEIHVPEMVGAG